jgi:hypothetical protein
MAFQEILEERRGKKKQFLLDTQFTVVKTEDFERMT